MPLARGGGGLAKGPGRVHPVIDAVADAEQHQVLRYNMGWGRTS